MLTTDDVIFEEVYPKVGIWFASFAGAVRAYKYDEHEFHRAQVVVALGLNGDPDDVAYIQEMAAGDNVYVSQSAISSLAIVGHEKARDAMVALYKEFKDDPRGPLLLQLLEQAYDWHLVKPEDIPKEN